MPDPLYTDICDGTITASSLTAAQLCFLKKKLSLAEWRVVNALLLKAAGGGGGGGSPTEGNVTTTLLSTGTAQVEEFTTVADVADSLDGLYFQLSDEDGTVGIWFDVDDSGTTIPAGAAALDRAIEVTTIVTDDTAGDVATAVAAAIDGDSKFSAIAVGSVVTVTHATGGDVADGAAATSTFTGFTVTTNGTASSGSTTAGVLEVSIANVGGAAGVVNGQAFPDATAVTYRGYYDEFATEMSRIAAITYDATGTTFLISTTP